MKAKFPFNYIHIYVYSFNIKCALFDLFTLYLYGTFLYIKKGPNNPPSCKSATNVSQHMHIVVDYRDITFYTIDLYIFIITYGSHASNFVLENCTSIYIVAKWDSGLTI